MVAVSRSMNRNVSTGAVKQNLVQTTEPGVHKLSNRFGLHV